MGKVFLDRRIHPSWPGASEIQADGVFVNNYLYLLTVLQSNVTSPLFIVNYNFQDFSSQYGSDQSYSYTASNLVGTPSMFPAYGDSPYTFAQREFSKAFKEVNGYRLLTKSIVFFSFSLHCTYLQIYTGNRI